MLLTVRVAGCGAARPGAVVAVALSMLNRNPLVPSAFPLRWPFGSVRPLSSPRVRVANWGAVALVR